MFTMARLLSPILFCFILLASWSSWGNKNLNNHTKGFTPLLNSFEYNLLTRVNKLNYLQALRKTLLDFELKMQKKGFKGKKSYYGNLFEHLFPHAFAEYKSEEWCVVGGRARIRDNGKCPIFGYPCSIDGTDAKENYKCGAIYGNVCVPIEDRRTLSARCHEAGKDVELDPPNYTQATHDIVTAYQQELCGGDVTDGSPCDFLNKRVAKINDQFRTPTRSTVISSTTQGKCHDIYKEGCNKNPHLLEPQIQIDGATFSEHVKFTTHQCYQETGVEKFTNQFTVVDGKGVERKFYFDPEKKKFALTSMYPAVFGKVWKRNLKKF